jgi:hypothetical protein
MRSAGLEILLLSELYYPMACEHIRFNRHTPQKLYVIAAWYDRALYVSCCLDRRSHGPGSSYSAPSVGRLYKRRVQRQANEHSVLAGEGVYGRRISAHAASLVHSCKTGNAGCCWKRYMHDGTVKRWKEVTKGWENGEPARSSRAFQKGGVKLRIATDSKLTSVACILTNGR